jgi:hypothetical protein
VKALLPELIHNMNSNCQSYLSASSGSSPSCSVVPFLASNIPSLFVPRAPSVPLQAAARFGDDLLPQAYRREALHDMCREAGIWRSDDKRQLAAGPANLAQSMSVKRAEIGVLGAMQSSLGQRLAPPRWPKTILHYGSLFLQNIKGGS